MKIGKYNDDEILEYMTDREGGFLGRSMFDDIRETILNEDKEIERLKTDKEQLNSLVNSCQKEIRKKDNIINTIEQFITNNSKDCDIEEYHVYMTIWILLQELKEGE